jgi:hypothetical protein
LPPDPIRVSNQGQAARVDVVAGVGDPILRSRGSWKGEDDEVAKPLTALRVPTIFNDLKIAERKRASAVFNIGPIIPQSVSHPWTPDMINGGGSTQ